MFILSQDGEHVLDTTSRSVYAVGSNIYITGKDSEIGEYENEDHAKWVLTDIMQCKVDGYETYYMPSSETVATRWRKF
jgi:hypothetical protein